MVGWRSGRRVVCPEQGADEVDVGRVVSGLVG